MGSQPGSLTLQDVPWESAVVGASTAAMGGLLLATQCLGSELTGSISIHSPLPETRGVRKVTPIIGPEIQGLGVLGGQQSDDARGWIRRGARSVAGQPAAGLLVTAVTVAVLTQPWCGSGAPDPPCMVLGHRCGCVSLTSCWIFPMCQVH